jgi:hypothetical protein
MILYKFVLLSHRYQVVTGGKRVEIESIDWSIRRIEQR